MTDNNKARNETQQLTPQMTKQITTALTTKNGFSTITVKLESIPTQTRGIRKSQWAYVLDTVSKLPKGEAYKISGFKTQNETSSLRQTCKTNKMRFTTRKTKSGIEAYVWQV